LLGVRRSVSGFVSVYYSPEGDTAMSGGSHARICHAFLVFSVRCNIYISRLCYDVSVRLSVRLSVTEVHWRIIANLGFKFRSKFTAHCGRGEW